MKLSDIPFPLQLLGLIVHVLLATWIAFATFHYFHVTAESWFFVPLLLTFICWASVALAGCFAFVANKFL